MQVGTMRSIIQLLQLCRYSGNQTYNIIKTINKELKMLTLWYIPIVLKLDHNKETSMWLIEAKMSDKDPWSLWIINKY